MQGNHPNDKFGPDWFVAKDGLPHFDAMSFPKTTCWANKASPFQSLLALWWCPQTAAKAYKQTVTPKPFKTAQN